MDTKQYINRRLLLTFHVLLIVIQGFGQSEPNSEYKYLDSLSQYYENQDLPKSIDFQKRTLKQAEKLGNEQLIFQSLQDLGNKELDYGDFEGAAIHLEQAFLYASSAIDSLGLFRTQANLFVEQGKTDQAIDLLLRALATTPKDEFRIQKMLLSDLGEFYREIQEPEKSLEYFRKLLQLQFKTASRSLKITYMNMSSVFLDWDMYDSALYYLDQSYENMDMEKDQFGISLYHNNKATILTQTGNYEEALPHALKSLEMKKEMGRKKNIATTYNLLSQIHLNLEKYADAEAYAQNSIDLQDPSSFNDARHNALRYLMYARIYQGKTKDLDDLLEMLITVNEQRFEAEKVQSIAEITTRYDVREKENQISVQESEISRQQTIKYSLMSGMALAVLSVFLLVLNVRNKARSNEKLAEKNGQIQELERLKTRWFTNIAHELRTPLTLVSGPIEKVLDEENVNASGKEDLLLARKSAKQLQMTVAEILDVSRLEEGQLIVNIKPANISRMARLAIASFDSLAKQRSITLISDVEDAVFATVDENKLNKSLLNLIMNAFKFTPKGGTITLSLTVKNHIIFQVTDTGSGISAEDLPHVFDRFFQTKDDSKARQGGTGVGLSLTKEIVALHGGEIAVTSCQKKKTIFTIKLPVKLLCEAIAEEEMSQEASGELSVPTFSFPLPSSKPIILLVEDNADMRQYIRGLLKQDYQLIEAENGLEGLAKLEESSIDLIISDVMMPEMDGISFARKVKSHNEWSTIPFITVTALANEGDKIYTLQIGVDDYLYKPFNPEELKVRVKNLLLNRQQRKTAEPEPGFDDALVLRLQELVNQRIADSTLSAADLATEAYMSDRNLRRYLKKLTGLSPIQFIQELRLIQALTLLERRKFKTLTEVSNAVGINRTSHFSDLFERRFGKRPQEYVL